MGAEEMTFQTKQEWIFEKLKNAIENCELKPGERILLDQVAAENKVSRIPVREALLQLQVEGLVEMVPHCGAVVSPVDFTSASDYFAISRELQVLAVKACIDRSSDEEISKIAAMVDEMEAAARKDDRDELFTGSRKNVRCQKRPPSRPRPHPGGRPVDQGNGNQGYFRPVARRGLVCSATGHLQAYSQY